jgi:putative ABC transport system permease protein
MNAALLVGRSLLQNWRAHGAAALGIAVAAAVLVGSLGAGDSVRGTLRAQAQGRLGLTGFAVESRDQFFRAGLPGEVAAALGGSAAALIETRGTASARGGDVHVDGVRVLGVGDDFWALAPAASVEQPGDGEAMLNTALAGRLGAAAGDEVIVRIPPVSTMSSEAPLSAVSGTPLVIRVTVRAVIAGDALADFSLRVDQSVPLNLFVLRTFLAERLGRIGGANTGLIAPPAGTLLAAVEKAVRGSFRLEDAGLTLRRAGAEWELVSERVFIPPAVESAARGLGGRGVFTYFADSITRGGRVISYCFVSAAEPGRRALREGEAALNTWAAAALGAGPGDIVELAFFVPGDQPGAVLQRRAASFRVAAVVPIEPGDRGLVPDFPGFAGRSDCRSWNPGIALDLSRITSRDQSYWTSWGGSPKAFVSLPEAQRLWGNRFGRLTAIRFGAMKAAPSEGTASPAEAAPLAAVLEARLAPVQLGVTVFPVRQIAEEASAHAVDFGQLFLGLSFFLVASALLLVFLISLLGVQRRTREIGTLSALGFTRARISLLFLLEGAAAAFAGCAAGVPLGLGFLHAIVAGLTGIWQDAIQTSTVKMTVTPASIATGLCAAFVVSTAVIALAVRQTLGRSTAGVLRGIGAGTRRGAVTAGGARIPTISGIGAAMAVRRRTRSLAVAALMGCGVFVVTAVAMNRPSLADPDSRSSGTGGFDLVGEVSIPATRDREAGMLDALPPGAACVSLRLLEGDDASCLNLNRAQQPRILGVPPSALTGRFSFTASAGARADPWSLLSVEEDAGVIPAIADATVITWGLGMKIGDELALTSETGVPVRLRLAAGLSTSIFQGSLLVSEKTLARYFPSSAGHSLFLVDAGPADLRIARAALEGSLAPLGLSLEKGAGRLARFDAVEIAYLGIFELLGWLGMMLGTLGLGIVALRNVDESRGELALLRAVGLPGTVIVRLVFLENAAPVVIGLAAGILASAVTAIAMPAAARTSLDAVGLVVRISGLLGAALAAILLCTLGVLRADITAALRGD